MQDSQVTATTCSPGKARMQSQQRGCTRSGELPDMESCLKCEWFDCVPDCGWTNLPPPAKCQRSLHRVQLICCWNHPPLVADTTHLHVLPLHLPWIALSASPAQLGCYTPPGEVDAGNNSSHQTSIREVTAAAAAAARSHLQVSCQATRTSDRISRLCDSTGSVKNAA